MYENLTQVRRIFVLSMVNDTESTACNCAEYERNTHEKDRKYDSRGVLAADFDIRSQRYLSNEKDFRDAQRQVENAYNI